MNSGILVLLAVFAIAAMVWIIMEFGVHYPEKQKVQVETTVPNDVPYGKLDK